MDDELAGWERSRDNITPAWTAKKIGMYKTGYEEGKAMVESLFPLDIQDDYLAYLFLLGYGQAIINHGRDLAHIGGKHNLDPEKKGRKA